MLQVDGSQLLPTSALSVLSVSSSPLQYPLKIDCDILSASISGLPVGQEMKCLIEGTSLEIYIITWEPYELISV